MARRHDPAHLKPGLVADEAPMKLRALGEGRARTERTSSFAGDERPGVGSRPAAT
jgi:hypothetical protein